MSPVAVWLLTVCLCRRFMGQQGQSSLVSLSKARAQLQPSALKPSPPKTTALLHKQGPCCVCERAPDTQPLMERIRLGCTTLIHCSRQHIIDASLSARKGLPGTETCCLKSLQGQTEAVLRPWTNIHLQILYSRKFLKCIQKQLK